MSPSGMKVNKYSFEHPMSMKEECETVSKTMLPSMNTEQELDNSEKQKWPLLLLKRLWQKMILNTKMRSGPYVPQILWTENHAAVILLSSSTKLGLKVSRNGSQILWSSSNLFQAILYLPKGEDNTSTMSTPTPPYSMLHYQAVLLCSCFLKAAPRHLQQVTTYIWNATNL